MSFVCQCPIKALLGYNKNRSQPQLFNHSLRDYATRNPEHEAHDPRKHFITMAKKYYVDEYAIKKIVGHTITDITEKIYTDRDLQWLTDEISKIP